MRPLAPALFSGTNCWPNASESFCAAMRPSVSAVPPARNGMSIFTGLVGQVCAGAGAANETIANPAISAVAQVVNFAVIVVSCPSSVFQRLLANACRLLIHPSTALRGGGLSRVELAGRRGRVHPRRPLTSENAMKHLLLSAIA